MISPEKKIERAKALLRDEVLTEAVNTLRAEAVDRLLSPATLPERLDEARHTVWALDAVMARLQAYVDEQLVVDRKQRGHRP